MHQAKNQDASAQALLYQQYSKAMFHICFRMMNTRERAEDVLQDAFIIAFKNIGQLRDASQFGGWLKRIVVNECIRQSKQNWKWEDWNEQFDQISNEQEEEWWKTVNIEIVYQKIKSLPEGCKQVFNLYVFEDYAHKEIAAFLNISESTSKSQYQRARQLLKEKIMQQMAIHG